MLIRRLALALLLCAPIILAVAVIPVLAQSVRTFTTAELMEATALDTVFNQFGDTLADTPETQGLPVDDDFLRAWRETSLEVFDAGRMQAELTGLMDGKFTEAELIDLAAFYRSEFGMRITAVERAVSDLEIEGQLAAVEQGAALIAGAGAGSPLDLQLGEMMELVSADITRAMVGQSVRGMLVGMSMARMQGDIEVPWQEIDAQLAQILPTMEAEIETTQRAMMAYAYKDMSPDELGEYLKFLRTDAAKKFYAVAGYAIGSVVTNAMGEFGEALAKRLRQVNV